MFFQFGISSEASNEKFGIPWICSPNRATKRRPSMYDQPAAKSNQGPVRPISADFKKRVPQVDISISTDLSRFLLKFLWEIYKFTADFQLRYSSSNLKKYL